MPVLAIASGSIKSKLNPASRIWGITTGPSNRSIDSLTESFPTVNCAQASSVGNRSATSFGGFCRSEEHTSELQSRGHLVCRLLLEKKKKYEKQLGKLPT